MESSDDTMPPDSTDVTVASEGTVPSPSLAVGSETIATSGSEIREELDTDAAQSSQLPEGSADSTSAEQKTDQVGTVLDVEQLVTGLLQILLPDVKQAKETIAEVTENQRILVETVQQENMKFQECFVFTEITAIMAKSRTYHTKLLAIRKKMTMIQEKAASLKKRAVRLQQQKEKNALQKEQKRDRDLEKERQLTAKPARAGH